MQATAARRLRRLVVVLVVMALLAAGTAILAFAARRQAKANEERAIASEKEALGNAVRAAENEKKAVGYAKESEKLRQEGEELRRAGEELKRLGEAAKREAAVQRDKNIVLARNVAARKADAERAEARARGALRQAEEALREAKRQRAIADEERAGREMAEQEATQLRAEIARGKEAEGRLEAQQQHTVVVAPTPNPNANITDEAARAAINRIDAATLNQIMPRLSPEKSAQVVPFIRQAMTEFEINTPLRQAAFLAQLAYESSELTYAEENLRYSAKALRTIFPTRFPTDDAANAYANQPDKIANLIYANRLGNGPPESGDGWKYRGRGFIPIVGRSNYRQSGQSLGLDLEGNPDLAATPEVAFRIAGLYWKSRGLNQLADAGSLRDITRRINGGLMGFEGRQKYYQAAKQALGVNGN